MEGKAGSQVWTSLDVLLIEVGREGIEPSWTHLPGDFKSPNYLNRLYRALRVILCAFGNGDIVMRLLYHGKSVPG